MDKFIPLDEWLDAKAKERIAQALKNSNNRSVPEYVVVKYTETPPKNLNDEELELYKKYKTRQG